MTPSNRGSQPKNGARQPRQSSGKLPARVYRRRRYMLLFASLVVVALVVLGAVGIVRGLGGGGGEEPVAEDTPSASPTTQAPVPDEKAASGKCPESKVGLRAGVDEKSFDEDAKPKFKMVIENNHTATCLIEVGTKEQEYLVQKNGDVVWSSKFCAAGEDENAEVSTEFAPESEKTAQLEWNRVQVDKNCNRTNKDFGPGEYELVVKLGDKESKPAKFELEKDAATKAKEKREAEEKKAEEKKSEEPDEKKPDEKKSDENPDGSGSSDD
ncbi:MULTISPECIES: hypothetical protein [Brevibacterium]|uniref:Uncharacterized protein n=1 Tax=Brevibacterium antiquum CNRZ 918 TaxID=1255637 RepID=A0A2H1J095_9MICO|nr:MULTISPECIES: hypothetical protein [Brevibacterium]SMX80885.1 hypothetical protein BANT918_01284 [Brevibacterium antiquum CNRZ 918]